MRKVLLVSCLVLTPAAAKVAPAGDAASTPDGAVEASVKALRRNDLHQFLSLTMTADQLREMERQWEVQRKQGPKPEEAAQFEQAMAMLTAPGAEERIMEMLKPKLEEMRPQMAMMTGMFTGMAQSAMEQNDQLSTKEKQQGREILDAVGKLFAKNDLTNPDKARRAVGIVCVTARKLNLKTLADLQRLNFRQLLGKGSLAFAGTKQVLDVYGVTVDKWLDTVDATTVTEDGKRALVRVTFEILGVRQTVDSKMVLVGSRWMRDESPDRELTAGFGR